MSTTAGHSVGVLTGMSQSSAGRGEGTIETAKTAVSTAIGLLNVVAEMAENVPYIGAVSKALMAFNEVLEEVDVCKKDCTAALSEAREFVDLMQEFQEKSVQANDSKESELRRACRELGSSLLKCLTTLQALGVDSERWRGRLKLLIRRGDVQTSVNECRDKMRIAKEKFNIAVATDTNRVAHEIRQHILLQKTSQPAQHQWRLRAANPIFYGRESEVNAAVHLIVKEAPARVAILGPGGIGKTSIALAVLHDPKVKELYRDHRCFMSCEAATTANAVVHTLANALGLVLEKDASPESAHDRLISFLQSNSGLICLDNLETPLDGDKPAMEELLNEIAALDCIALLITSRDTSIPSIKWTSPALAHLRPFSQEAALSTWDDICHEHDAYAIKLVEAVDCMPLAVTLLARLAAVEGNAKDVWVRWETERTELIQIGGHGHRLFGVGASVELSLQALIRREPEAITALGIICIFASGLKQTLFMRLSDSLKDRLPVGRALSVLKQFSLVYIESHEWKLETEVIRVLSPIRHHIQQHHVPDELFVMFADIVMQDPRRGPWGWDTDAVLKFGISRPGPCRERCLEMVTSEPERVLDIEVLSQAIEGARILQPQIQTRLLRQLGFVQRVYNHEYENARAALSEAIAIDEQLGDRQALCTDWTHWLLTYPNDFRGREDEFERLDEVQEAIQRAWQLSRNESRVWDRDFWHYHSLAEVQHFVNEVRRKRDMPIIHRSGLYADNASTEALHELFFSHKAEQCYDRLVEVSSPPWDLTSILEAHQALGHDMWEEQRMKADISGQGLFGEWWRESQQPLSTAHT